MWTYVQKTGDLIRDGEIVGTGYSGHGVGLDNPADDKIPNVGPLPIGSYTIGQPFDHPHCGPFVMRLHPSPDNDMGGRFGFLIHGDNASMNHSASDGCIIMNRLVRGAIAASHDSALTVIAELPPEDMADA